MKIKIGEKVYLQKYDTRKVWENCYLYFPRYVIEEIMINDKTIGNPGIFNFCYVFEMEKSVRWLMKQDWIIDYGLYYEMSLRSLILEREHLVEEYNNIVKKLNSMPLCSYLRKKLAKESVKIESLEIMIAYRNHELGTSFVFPDEYLQKNIQGF